jgi:tetratricopeptide (TPR) repeat protein
VNYLTLTVSLACLLFVGCSPARHAKQWQKDTQDAVAAEKSGDYELAAKYYLAGIKTAQDGLLGGEAISASTYDWSRMMGMLGKFEQAEEGFKRALALEEPIYGNTGGHAYMRWFELARLYDAWGRPKDSVMAYQRAFPAALKLRIDEDYPKIYKHLLHDYADELDKAGAPPARSAQVRKNAGPKKNDPLEQEILYYPPRNR